MPKSTRQIHSTKRTENVRLSSEMKWTSTISRLSLVVYCCHSFYDGPSYTTSFLWPFLTDPYSCIDDLCMIFLYLVRFITCIAKAHVDLYRIFILHSVVEMSRGVCINSASLRAFSQT